MKWKNMLLILLIVAIVILLIVLTLDNFGDNLNDSNNIMGLKRAEHRGE